MKQLFQNLRTGVAETLELPRPVCPKRCVLIQTGVSLISPGTERMLQDFGRASYLAKAKQQPEKVKLVLQKMRTDGIESTVRAVFTKLDQPLPVGYSNVGTVLEVGEGVTDFKAGDRVVSNGYHAELVVVPSNLCAKLPDQVSEEQASFTVLGAIALQGVRLAAPTLGETFVVYGLGLIGQLTCQILRANGCRVIGIDLNQERVDKAKSCGFEAIVAGEDPSEISNRICQLNQGREVDGVLITASTTSNTPIQVAPQFTRKRGRIVLVGVVGLQLERSEFFKKEISFQVSCSYGPGRYDDGYEREGLDYPIGYVRWTEQRNFDAVLELLRTRALEVEGLISEKIPFSSAEAAYERLLSESTGYGYLFQYERAKDHSQRRVELVQGRKGSLPVVAPGLGFIGAGSYTRGILLDAFNRAGPTFTGIVSQSGQSSADLARKYRFSFHATDPQELLADSNTTGVVITTRHDSHAELVQRALKAQKHVFVEKPLCLTREELQQLRSVYESTAGLALMVGFNRRYAPLSKLLRHKLAEATSEPASIHISVNAGALSPDHWTQREHEGGGRIVGELCHFIDTAIYLADSEVVKTQAAGLGAENGRDTVKVALAFANGAIASIDYFTTGHKALPKERIEVFAGGKAFQINNFRSLQVHGVNGFSGKKLWRQDKGQRAQAQKFWSAITGGESDISSLANSAFETMEVTFQVVEALREDLSRSF